MRDAVRGRGESRTDAANGRKTGQSGHKLGTQRAQIGRASRPDADSRTRDDGHDAEMAAARDRRHPVVTESGTDLSFLRLLELYWADVPECRVPARRVVEAFDVVEHVSPGLLSTAVDLARRALGLQAAEEALHGSAPPPMSSHSGGTRAQRAFRRWPSNASRRSILQAASPSSTAQRCNRLRPCA